MASFDLLNTNEFPGLNSAPACTPTSSTNLSVLLPLKARVGTCSQNSPPTFEAPNEQGDEILAEKTAKQKTLLKNVHWGSIDCVPVSGLQKDIVDPPVQILDTPKVKDVAPSATDSATDIHEAYHEWPTDSDHPMNFPPGLEPPPGTPSHGSVLHTRGNCRPCPLFWTMAGCAKGKDCTYCHDVCHAPDFKIGKQGRSALLRFGLATPKFSNEMNEAKNFCMQRDDSEDLVMSGSEQESTTCAGSEQDSFDTSDREQDMPNSVQSILFQPPSAPPGLAPPPGTPSLGAMKHANGGCRPCAWFWKAQGCQNGSECLHCHACPADAIKNRKKSKHTMFRLGLATPKAGNAPEKLAPFSLSLSGQL